MRRLTHWTSSALLSLLLLAACGGDEPRIPANKLRSLVLQPQDVGNAFATFDFGPQTESDYRPGPRQNPRRFGREEGWKARYRKANPRVTTGPLVIESRADLFQEEAGAEKDIEAYDEEFQVSIDDSGGSAHHINVRRIGDETVAMTLTQSGGAMTVRFYRIAWRERNVTVFLEVSGFDRTLTLETVLMFADRQQRRIARATPV
jgi:hypothetical protein